MKHYNDDKVDRQGQFRGMELVGGDFYCPMMPTPLVTAGTNYINSRTDEDRAHALNLIQSRKDYQAKVKEYGPTGDQRRQCPALGPPHATSPATAVPNHDRPPSSTSTPPLSAPQLPCPPSPSPSGTPAPTSTSAPGRASLSQAPCWPSGGRNTPCSPLCGKRPGPAAQPERGRQRQPQEARPR